MKNNIMSLSKFLSRYGGLQGNSLTKVTHEEVKRLFPYLKRSSFDEIYQNPELISMGKVMLISDGRNIIPYYVPTLKDEDIELLDFNREDPEPLKIDDNVYDYANMSVYELRCLLRRKFNSYRNQCCARKELAYRGIELRKKYKRNNKILED